MKHLKFVLPAILLALSTNVNATVLNTLNGQQYEWLELTETVGLSRVQVEAMLTDSTSSLYGYEYASRSLVEDLFLSYATWAGVNHYYGDSGILSGISNMFNDFGATYTYNYGPSILYTADVGAVSYTSASSIDGLMGTSSECGLNSCRAATYLYDNNGTNTATYQSNQTGWDSDSLYPLILRTSESHVGIGSYLVRPSVVPLPAAAWLFGSALLGFFGFSRRKANA